MFGLDLFSGIGGITKALEGYVTPIAYCENDRYAQAVLLSRMASGELPRAPIADDVRSLCRGELPAIDIIYGGFPCQDISVAGRGVGLGGERSGLFFEVARLAGEIRPRFIFLENVPAIRSRGADIVVGEMARLGYDCRWITLSAAEVGANHRRERWWLLAHARSERSQASGPTEERHEIMQRALAGGKGDVADPTSQRVEGHGTAGIEVSGVPIEKGLSGRDCAGTGASHWSVEPNVCRVVDGLPFRVDRLRALGNSVVPAQAREAFERLMGLKHA